MGREPAAGGPHDMRLPYGSQGQGPDSERQRHGDTCTHMHRVMPVYHPEPHRLTQAWTHTHAHSHVYARTYTHIHMG